MSSSLLTVLLALLATILGTLTAVQLRGDDVRALFGPVPREVGQLLYEFDGASVAQLSITSSTGESATFVKRGGIWVMTAPLQDLADQHLVAGLVSFARSLRIEDIIPGRDTTPEEFGFRAGRYDMELVDGGGRRVASFSIGRRGAWHRLDPETNRVFETVFIRPGGSGAGDHVYVCSAPEVRRSLLDKGFGKLRDHHPFLFDWEQLASVQVAGEDGELLLSRTSPAAGWRITKPLTLRTDPQAVGDLLANLTRLEAIAVHDPGAVTTVDPETPYLAITLHSFGPDGAPVQTGRLAVEPPASEQATTVLARVDGRSVVFELPLASANGRPGIAQLPVSLNGLRSKTLASLNIGALRSITIDSPHLPRPIFVTLGKARQDGTPRWLYRYGGELRPANEFSVKRLLEAVTVDEVVGFSSDAATDLAPFGLDSPAKTVRFEGGEGENLELLFGRAGDRFHAMRSDSPSVVEISGNTFTGIPDLPHDWRDALLWPFNIIDLVGLHIERKGRPPLSLTYNFLDESWTAKQRDVDVTPLLNTQRANNFLTFLEGLRVTRWLGADSPEAQRALDDPVFSLTVLYRQVNEQGDPIGVTPVTLEVARASQSPQNRIFYGRLSGDTDYFVLDLDAAKRLAVDLLEEPGTD